MKNITENETVLEILNDYKNKKLINDFKIEIIKQKMYNFYYVNDFKPETILESNTKINKFTVYKNKENSILINSFEFDMSNSEKDFENKLKDSIFLCNFSKIKKYSLPKKQDKEVLEKANLNKNLENINFNYTFLEEFFSLKIELFKEMIKKENDKGINLSLNYIEFLNSQHSKSLFMSTGIENNYLKYKFYIEFVLTIKDEITKKEKECIVYEKINNIFLFDFENFFYNTIKKTKDTIKVITSKKFNGKIALINLATCDFFNPDLIKNSLINMASAKLKFDKLVKYDIGEKIISSKFENITIYSNPEIENEQSIPFDSEGIKSKRICLIENGVLKNFFASKRYATYLNIKATGNFGPIELECGSFSEKEILDETELIIDSFSSFVANPISGDFSCEIRLGYFIENKKRIPFSGGLFTGNIFEILKEVKFSKEIVNVPGFKGPKTILFQKAKIIGV